MKLKYFLGFRNGLNPRSLSSKASNTRNLPNNHKYMASEASGVDRRYLHGGGSRYIQENNDEYYTDGLYSTNLCGTFSSQWFVHSKYLHFILACKQYLDEFDLPDAYDVPGNNLPGSQKQTHTVNSVNNSDHAGDGPGSLDYDMDSSLMGYYPLVVSFNLLLALERPRSQLNSAIVKIIS